MERYRLRHASAMKRMTADGDKLVDRCLEEIQAAMNDCAYEGLYVLEYMYPDYIRPHLDIVKEQLSLAGYVVLSVQLPVWDIDDMGNEYLAEKRDSLKISWSMA